MQMVNLMQNGQPVRMSKRTGNAITLTDLLEEVPIDSARFLFNMHEAGSSIDFDLDQAVKTDNDKPRLLRPVRPRPHLLHPAQAGEHRRGVPGCGKTLTPPS